MALPKKGSRKIVVDDTEFRWRTSGNDHGVDVYVWPVSNEHTSIHAVVEHGNLVTSRVIRSLLDYMTIPRILAGSGMVYMGYFEGLFPNFEFVKIDRKPKICVRCSDQLGFETICQSG